jgi:hypothetical protein
MAQSAQVSHNATKITADEYAGFCRIVQINLRKQFCRIVIGRYRRAGVAEKPQQLNDHTHQQNNYNKAPTVCHGCQGNRTRTNPAIFSEAKQTTIR